MGTEKIVLHLGMEMIGIEQAIEKAKELYETIQKAKSLADDLAFMELSVQASIRNQAST